MNKRTNEPEMPILSVIFDNYRLFCKANVHGLTQFFQGSLVCLNRGPSANAGHQAGAPEGIAEWANRIPSSQLGLEAGAVMPSRNLLGFALKACGK